MKADEILTAAAQHMRDRAATYDKPEGERSMAQTVAIFNQFHGTSLTEAQGWHFMQVLKDVRLFARGRYHADSAEDCTAYSALKAEAMAAQDDFFASMATGDMELQSETAHAATAPVVIPPAPEYDPASVAFAGSFVDADGWIRWDGGECPVPPGTHILYKYSMTDGLIFNTEHPQSLQWNHKGTDEEDRLVAYQILKPSRKTVEPDAALDVVAANCQPEPVVGGWVEWSGGECPVDPDTLVDVIFRDTYRQRSIARSLRWSWYGNAPHPDIMEYRVVKQPTTT
jgi:hypothetical protein